MGYWAYVGRIIWNVYALCTAFVLCHLLTNLEVPGDAEGNRRKQEAIWPIMRNSQPTLRRLSQPFWMESRDTVESICEHYFPVLSELNIGPTGADDSQIWRPFILKHSNTLVSLDFSHFYCGRRMTELRVNSFPICATWINEDFLPNLKYFRGSLSSFLVMVSRGVRSVFTKLEKLDLGYGNSLSNEQEMIYTAFGSNKE